MIHIHLISLTDIKDYIKLSSLHVRSVAWGGSNPDYITFYIELDFWYGIFYGRKYVSHIEKQIAKLAPKDMCPLKFVWG